MNENLFNHININIKNTHVPDGTITDFDAIEEFCDQYEARIEDVGGIDIQVLGIGGNGHIGFNEPGSSIGSMTRIKTLTGKTREDNARFFKNLDEVPVYAITMGIGTIMNARKVVLLASGESKAEAVAAALEGPVTTMWSGERSATSPLRHVCDRQSGGEPAQARDLRDGLERGL